MARKLYIDLETRSPVDLRVCGQYVYAENPLTEIILLAYGIDQGPVSVWFCLRGDPIPSDLLEALLDPDTLINAHNAAFERILMGLSPLRNQGFLPREVVQAIRPLRRWDCTAARSSAMGLPRALENACRVLGLTVQKDLEGGKLMMRMCRPRALDSLGGPIYLEDAHSIQRLGEYCIKDVEAQKGLDEVVANLSPFERQVWEATEAMNDRGVLIDQELLIKMSMFVQDAQAEVNERIYEATDRRVPKVTNTAALKNWLIDSGFPDITSTDKQAINDLLAIEEIPEIVREVLLLRQEGGKSSTSKYKALISRANRDGRIRGSFIYCGAQSTKRWCLADSTQILIKSEGKVRWLPIYLVSTGHLVWDGQEWVSHEGVVFSGVKRTIYYDGLSATLDHEVYIWTDCKIHFKNAIERKIPLYTGEKPAPLVFNANPNQQSAGYRTPTYDIINAGPRNRFMANGKIVSNSSVGTQLQNLPSKATVKPAVLMEALADIKRDTPMLTIRDTYGKPLVIASELIRPTFIGPQDVWLVRGDYSQIEDRLNNWFAGQHEQLAAFRAYDEGTGPDLYIVTAALMYGVDPSSISKSDPRRQHGKILKLAGGFGGGKGAIMRAAKMYKVDMTEDEAEHFKVLYREANPGIVQFWRDTEDASVEVAGGPIGGRVEFRPNTWFIKTPKALVLKNPAGSVLYYWYPSVEKVETPWGTTRDTLVFYAEDSQTKKWTKQYSYGGLLVENLCQHASRCITADSLIRLQDAGYPPVLTVHDENVCEVSKIIHPDADAAAKVVRDIMMQAPPWAKGLPVNVDCAAHDRYLKD